MMALLHFNSKNMFLLSCMLLVAGSLVQGFPMKNERYQRIRCIPGDNDIACAQEKATYDQALESNVIDRSPISKRAQSYIASNSFSAEDLGSGNTPFSGEGPGSASENDVYEIQDSKQDFTEENFIV